MRLPRLNLLANFVVAVVLAFCGATAAAQEVANYDESKLPPYTLPDPLTMNDGRQVASAAMWRQQRRPELLELFETNVYGRRPPMWQAMRFRVESSDWHGQATRKVVHLDFRDAAGWYKGFAITMFVPRHAGRRVPAFVGLHLFDTKAADPIPGKLLDVEVGTPLPGKDILSVILQRGYAIATLDAADFCPDNKDTFRSGLLAHWYPKHTGPPGPQEAGAIATWAWALSRALDYFHYDRQIDPRQVIVIGHSRMGKTALWAGAEDQRFAAVISNNSGCGGAALSRRIFGETVARINRVFPHWFCGNFKKYDQHEDRLPVDQHELVALAAPRPVYVASAVDDGWADPRGEFLAAAGAEPVYRLFGVSGVRDNDAPPLNQSIGGAIGYHLRAGKHALTDFDWLKYLDWADQYVTDDQRAPSNEYVRDDRRVRRARGRR
ncbi:MAG: acetylxylan esterase [Pirellulales bacterium]